MLDLGPYLDLMRAFLDETISTKDFETRYLAKMKSDPHFYKEPVFGLLDEVFGAVDAYTDLPGPREKDWIDENELRAIVRRVYPQLEALNR